MLSADDWLAMRDDLNAAHADNAVSLALRRGAATLAAQTARVTRLSGGGQSNVAESVGTQQVSGRALIAGGPTLDIAPGDRFTLDGVLFEVRFVRPNRRASTQAEADAVE